MITNHYELLYRILCNDESVYHYENIMGVQVILTLYHIRILRTINVNMTQEATKIHTKHHFCVSCIDIYECKDMHHLKLQYYYQRLLF
jgi:hypothetical protein